MSLVKTTFYSNLLHGSCCYLHNPDPVHFEEVATEGHERRSLGGHRLGRVELLHHVRK